jgi:hypothetical protein
MSMDTQIRVRTEARYGQLYNDLKGVVVSEFHELFFVCACLGYRAGEPKALSKPGDRFWSSTITPQEWSCYYAMALEKSGYSYEALGDDEVVIALAEGYANRGMEVLLEEFIGEYLLPDSKAALQLDVRCSEELPKHFLHFLYDQADANDTETK